jgi:hypothetical protein
MFKDNKHTKWYFSIIKNAQNRKNIEGYFESHHIIPNSIMVNKDTVKLNAKEHYICHLLLCKMVKTKNHRIKMYSQNLRNVAYGKKNHHKHYLCEKVEL